MRLRTTQSPETELFKFNVFRFGKIDFPESCVKLGNVIAAVVEVLLNQLLLVVI